jgi:hypothetical protein
MLVNSFVSNERKILLTIYLFKAIKYKYNNKKIFIDVKRSKNNNFILSSKMNHHIFIYHKSNISFYLLCKIFYKQVTPPLDSS